jgi:TRAP-type C4-dicarboxylate transport system permease small subunit
LIAGFSALTLDVLWGVFSRYLLGEQSRWTEELAIYLLVWVSLLGASLAYAQRAHLGVDYLVERLDPAARKLAHGLAELLVMAFAVYVLMFGGGQLVTKTLESGQVSPALGVSMAYVYLAAPISGVFFLLFASENLLALLRGSDAADEE